MPDQPFPLSTVEALSEKHDVAQFDCKKHPSLNEWLKKYALANQRSDTSRTFVVHRNNVVAGYYSIAPGSIAKEDAPARIAKGMPNLPVPVVLLARLAVHHAEQGQGLGKALLKDALLRIAQAVDIVGGRAVLVHAMDDDARKFYQRFGFEQSPTHELHLMLLMKDLRHNLKLATKK